MLSSLRRLATEEAVARGLTADMGFDKASERRFRSSPWSTRKEPLASASWQRGVADV
ncbi:hypothetical protein MPLA_1850022 [Mesorhizobium sp. ORS 3359]|nr:hypothetical protein MPLA_1850022 [Mesorhizobium sp. ORS 3359]